MPHQFSLKRKSTQPRPSWPPGLFLGYLTPKYVASSSKCRGQGNSPEMSCSLKLQHDVWSKMTSEVPAFSPFSWYSHKIIFVFAYKDIVGRKRELQGRKIIIENNHYGFLWNSWYLLQFWGWREMDL